MFQGFEARGTEIRGRQGALDNIKSVINDYWLPYDIFLNRKDFNYNEQLFPRPEPQRVTEDGGFSDGVRDGRRRRRSIRGTDAWFPGDPGDQVTEERRRRRSVHGRDAEYLEDSRMFENEKDHVDYDRRNIDNVRRKRQISKYPCAISKIYLFYVLLVIWLE